MLLLQPDTPGHYTDRLKALHNCRRTAGTWQDNEGVGKRLFRCTALPVHSILGATPWSPVELYKFGAHGLENYAVNCGLLSVSSIHGIPKLDAQLSTNIDATTAAVVRDVGTVLVGLE